VSESLQDFLNELSQEGDVQGSASGFTLSSDKAREKLKKFALAHPENYFLLIVAGLQALGARRFELVVDADDLIVRGDCRVDRNRLAKLWESVAGGEQADAGLRLLGLAILTSVRFEKVRWIIESSDQQGSFRLIQSVITERIPDPVIEIGSPGFQGTVVSVKRRDLRGVASRFFNQLGNLLRAKAWEEERLLAERVFLGVLDGFTFNGRSLDCQLHATRGLAMLKTGEPPDFLTAKYCYHEAGEQDMVVLIGRGLDLPGVPKKISWLWHGLRMGENRLGLSYDFCRAFVVADDLRCDLSLTALADTWARQKAIRLAREATRRALELMAESYLALQGDNLDCQDAEMESYLLEVVASRIDIQRNRHRLGSFNDTLVRCALFTVSESDGTKRRAALLEIWEWMEKGENPALFRKIEDWLEVPAWKDRPAIVYAEQQHSDALIKIFGTSMFLDGTTVARSVERLSGSRTKFEPPAKTAWQGQCEVEGQELSWSLSLDDNVEKEGLVVLRAGEVYFEDTTLNLPEGFLFYGEVDWEPSFGGTVAEDSLRDYLPKLALQEIANLLDAFTDPPSLEVIEAIGLVCRGLGKEKNSWARRGYEEKRWLVARESDGTLAWISPESYWNRVRNEKVACYFISFQEARDPGRELPLCLVLPPDVVEFIPDTFYDVRGVELHRARPVFSFPETGFEVVELEASRFVHRFISRIQVGFPMLSGSDSQAVLELNLRGHKLQTRTVSSFVAPVTVCLDIEDGWPDSKGCHLVDKEQIETIKGFIPEVLTEASRRLLLQLSPQALSGLDPELQRTLTIDLWSEGERDRTERVSTSDGNRISFAQLHACDQVRYYTDVARTHEVPPGTVFFTSAQVEALEMVAEVDNWVDELAEVGATMTATKSVPRKLEPVSSPKRSTPSVKRADSSKDKPAPLAVAKVPRPLVDNPQPAKEEVNSSASESVVSESMGSEPITEPPDSEPPTSEVEAPIWPLEDEHLAGSTVNALRSLLSQLGSNDRVPFMKEFEFYLSSVKEQEQTPSILAEIEGNPVVRSLVDPSPDTLICLLSGLYSLFNRGLERVEDSHEREFHRVLVQYAQRLSK
jgi:hypothetical protein